MCNWTSRGETLSCNEPEYDSRTGHCILHSKEPRKNKDLFKKRVNQKLQRGDYKFAGVFFPEAVSFTGTIVNANFSEAEFVGGAEFNIVTFSEEANFRDAMFLKGASFYAATFRGKANFFNARFDYGATFQSCEFQGGADFAVAKFGGNATFTSTKYGGEANFSEAIFEGDIDFLISAFQKDFIFSDVKVAGEADFAHTEFNGQTNFNTTRFQKKAMFFKVHFKNKAEFMRVSIGGVSNFSEADFGGEALFCGTSFSDAAAFYKARFRQDADFSMATFGRWAVFVDAIFEGIGNFPNSSFKETADFLRAEFRSGANFQLVRIEEANFVWTGFSGTRTYKYESPLKSEFQGAATFFGAFFRSRTYFAANTFSHALDLSRCQFGDATLFSSMGTAAQTPYLCFEDVLLEQAEKVRFENFDLRCTSFAGTNLRHVRFHNCNWPRKDNRIAVYDELKPEPSDAETLRFLYRDLKGNLEGARDYELAGDFYYAEMETARRHHPNKIWQLVLTLFWVTAGYAERPLQAFLVFCGLVALLAVLFLLPSASFWFEQPATERGVELIRHWHLSPLEALAHSIRSVFLRPYFFQPESWWAHFVTLAGNIMGPIQLAFLVIALRRRFRR